MYVHRQAKGCNRRIVSRRMPLVAPHAEGPPGPGHHGPCRAMDHLCAVHRGCVFGVLAMFGLNRRQRPNWWDLGCARHVRGGWVHGISEAMQAFVFVAFHLLSFHFEFASMPLPCGFTFTVVSTFFEYVIDVAAFTSPPKPPSVVVRPVRIHSPVGRGLALQRTLAASP